ncbi:MAG: hypothetical protein FD138_315 [Planctomycetota bacterium]|nr:MAG: hypothetical protein FD138_315 [Planctomycetota bacterium]
MSLLTIKPVDGRTAFEPSETIAVEAQWELDAEPEALEVRLVWNTSGKGDTDIGVEKRISLDSPGLTESRSLEVKLPAAPYSFSGKYVSLIWALELVAHPANTSCRTEITIAPGRREVLLHREPVKQPADE